MQCATRPRITELNPHLLCVLCEGYLIDATAITECLHAFCKKCIVQYLETKKYCPVCDVLVHKTKPLQNLKPDKILQSIVYKSVPDLYANEMCNRRKFYSNVHPQQKPDNPELRGEITEASEFITFNDTISLSLEYINFLGDQNYFYVASSSKRYLRCDATVTVKHLQKLISAKYGLAIKHEIRFFFNGIQLPDHLTLLDIAYISSWKRNGFIRLLYQILEVRKTVMKLAKPEITPVTTPASTIVKTPDNKVDKLPLDVNNHVNNISDQAKESKLSTSSTVTVSTAVTATPTSLVNTDTKTSDGSGSAKPCSDKSAPPPVLSSSNTTLNSISVTATTPSAPSSIASVAGKSNENSVLNKIVEKLEKKASTGSNATSAVVAKSDDRATQPFTTQINNKENAVKPISQTENTTEKSNPSITTVPIISTTAVTSLKKKTSPDCPIPTKIPKLMNCDSPKPPRVDVCKEVESISTPIMSVNSTASVTSSASKFIPSNSITPTVNYTPSNKLSSPPPLRKIMCYPAARVSASEPNKAIVVPTTTTTSIKKAIVGVKTFTRPWSYSATPTAVAPVKPTTMTDMSKTPSVQKPVKFHKARRNVPRFLGNPSSGIRPLYQGNSSEANSTSSDGKSNSSIETTIKIPKSISLLKVDPKTLAPIACSSASSKSTNSGANSVKKTFYSSTKQYNMIPDYPCSVTNSPNFVGNLSSASVAGKLSAGAAFPPPPFPNMAPNSLLPSFNPYLCAGMYPSHFPPGTADSAALNGPSSLDYIKAMAAFHSPFPPPINPLFNPQLHPKLKHDKVKTTAKSTSSPPAIQRIPPTSKTPISEVTASITETPKSSPLPVSSTPSNLSNGVYKNTKIKKESSFAINNLIPIDEAKNITHSCSADGVHQVCDQLTTDPASKKKTVELDAKSNSNDKVSRQAENKDKQGEKNTSK
ncbi:polycomb group protein Psc-like [Planococcus citri]|uniref:polycomb group protein Psc-like n=1 Tax=Planococcus citri TaxID=170843 RepID=UPI0031F89C57